MNNKAQRSSHLFSMKVPLIEYSSASENSSSMPKPNATMIRKLQNIGATLGIVLSTAC